MIPIPKPRHEDKGQGLTGKRAAHLVMDRWVDRFRAPHEICSNPGPQFESQYYQSLRSKIGARSTMCLCARPIPATPPCAPTGSKHGPVPPVKGPVPPLTLLLAPHEAKPTQTTVIHHGAKWRIPKHHMTARDLPRVPRDSQSMPRTCWACDPEAPTTPLPVLHRISRHHTQPTTHLPP